jgi:hypothetical protein
MSHDQGNDRNPRRLGNLKSQIVSPNPDHVYNVDNG